MCRNFEDRRRYNVVYRYLRDSGRYYFFSAYIILLLILAGCTSVHYSEPLAGRYIRVTVAPKGFIIIGAVSASSTETHHSSPFGFTKSVEGSKITYVDLIQEAAKLEADDIIDVKIDINSNYKKGAFDWMTGWTRTYTYTGTALAIKYVSDDYAPDPPDPDAPDDSDEFDNLLFLNR